MATLLPLKDLNPTRRRAVVTLLLIAANAAVYALVVLSTTDPVVVRTSVADVTIDGRVAYDLHHALVPCELTSGRPQAVSEVLATYRGGDRDACDAPAGAPELFPDKRIALSVVLSMFLHGSLAHVGFNLLFLWVFGNNVEDRMGPLPFLAFYLLGGLVATLAQVALDPHSSVPVIGASGAIAAVMGAYFLWFPRATVITYIAPIFVLPLRARWVLAAWFALQFFTNDPGVAWMAHVGGFTFGAVVALLARSFWPPPPPPAPVTRF